MSQSTRLLIALAMLLSGLLVMPRAALLAGVISWQRFANGYEDLIVVTRARCENDDQELEVRAETTAGGAATLTVYDATSNAFIGTLSYEGGNEHRGEFDIFPCPAAITVRSTLGGQATVIVLPGSGTPPTVTPSATAVVPPSATPPPTATATPQPEPVIRLPFFWLLETGTLDLGMWSLRGDGSFTDEENRTGRWGFQAATNRFVLLYDEGHACEAFFAGRFLNSTTLRGRSTCMDGSGTTGIWQAQVDNSAEHFSPIVGDRGQVDLLMLAGGGN